MDTVQLLFLNAGLRAALACIYALVGLKLTRRPVAGEAGVALRLFGVGWYALAVSSGLAALSALLLALGALPFALGIALAQANLVVVCVALWGLLYYLGYLFTGRRSILAPVSVFYALLAVGLLYVAAAGDPVGIVARNGSATLDFAAPLERPWVLVVVALLLGPHLVGAVAYASLYARAETRTQRYRIGMVAGAFFGWFGAAGVASATGWSASPWWPPVSLAVALVASVAILLAYYPPAWARRRWRLVGAEADPASATATHM